MMADIPPKRRRAKATKPKTSEHDEQAMLCQWLDAQGIGYFAVPNEHEPRRLGRLKARGLRRGAPDLVLHRLACCCAAPHTTMQRVCPSLRPIAVEVKAVSGDLSHAQHITHESMRKEGWVVVVAFGVDDAVRQLMGLGVGR